MREIASSVLMIEPNAFGFDVQTAVTNLFQHETTADEVALRLAAQREFGDVVSALRVFGVDVVVYRHGDDVPRPNAVFPNNWLTTWPDGRVFLYPMATASRRVERSEAVLQALRQRYQVRMVADISEPEFEGHFLESTGVMIFDRAHRRVYGCESLRCDVALFERHARGLGYEPVLFEASDRQGAAVYHTNLMLSIHTTTAVLCAEAIKNVDDRRRVARALEETGHELVNITYEQMDAYCGNVIELANAAGQKCLLLSQSAYDAFTLQQREVLGRDKTLLPVAVPTIQGVGGGSVRCMVAELFLPKAEVAATLRERTRTSTSP